MLARRVASVLETCESVLVSKSDTVVDPAIGVLSSVVSNRAFVEFPMEECVFVV